MTIPIKKHRGKASKPNLKLISLRLDEDVIDFLNQRLDKNLQVTIRKILRGYVDAHLDDAEKHAFNELMLDEEFSPHVKIIDKEEVSLNNVSISNIQPETLDKNPCQKEFHHISDARKVYERIRELMKKSHLGSDGYGAQIIAAKLAYSTFGSDWIAKDPATVDAIVIRLNLRDIVKETTPKSHSNYYVVWQRFQNYAAGN